VFLGRSTKPPETSLFDGQRHAETFLNPPQQTSIHGLAESFNASLKNEMVNRTVFPTKAHARDAIVRYVELYYNRKRIHSALGYKTPYEILSGRTDNTLAA
jgi:transposase InsO family protein